MLVSARFKNGVKQVEEWVRFGIILVPGTRSCSVSSPRHSSLGLASRLLVDSVALGLVACSTNGASLGALCSSVYLSLSARMQMPCRSCSFSFRGCSAAFMRSWETRPGS